jgi:hypothetical protein
MVTMNGSGFRSRMGVTLLHGIDRAEWVAPERADYVRIAAELAQDIERLNHIRLEQRDRMEASPLMNEKLFASHFGNALRDMWQTWCAGGQASAPTGGKSAPEAHTAWPPTAIQISVGTGTIITLEQAQTQLQTLTERALEIAPRQVVLAGHMEPPPITEPAWLEVLTWCSYILDSLPNEPLALATLAEIEHAHGRTDLASMYLNFAQKSLSPTTVL